MITIDKAHKLIQKYLNITENQYEIKYYNYDEKCFRLYGSGFEIGFSEKWVNEFRITQTPFKNLYYGKDYNMIIFNENNLISILKSIRLYLDSFKIFIKNNIDLIL